MRGTRWALVLVAGIVALMMRPGLVSAQDPAAVKPVAVVNGEPITLAEIEAVLKKNGPLPVELPAAKRKEMHFMVLGMLIDDLLMEQFLRKNGPRIEEAEINKRMADLELEAKKKGKTVQDFYKEWNQTEKQVRNSLVKMLQWDAYVKDRINEADLKRFYGDTKDFFDEVTVHVHHILLRVPFNAPEADRQATRQKLLAIRQEIVSGQISFADAAKKYSQCPSAKDGGNIGFIPRKLSPVEESFAKAAFALQAGQVSDVVATDFGLHLIKVTERKPGKKLSEFDKVKELVRDLYVEEMYQSLLAQLRQAAKVEMP